MPYPQALTEPLRFSPSRSGPGVRRESRVTRFRYRLKNEPYTNRQPQCNQMLSLSGGRPEAPSPSPGSPAFLVFRPAQT